MRRTLRPLLGPLICALAAALALTGCHRTVLGPKPADPNINYSAVIQTDMGNIAITLFPKQAPLAVGNFVGLATGTQAWRDPATHRVVHRRLFDGTIFHRVIPNFVIQGGDPGGTGRGDPGYGFANEVSPTLTFDRPGRVGMANTGDPNSNGCQFFITTAPVPRLNGGYTIFGQVTSGQDVVDAISEVPRDKNDRPLKPVHIVKVTITEVTMTPAGG